MTDNEKEVDISVFTAMLTSKFVETVRGEPAGQYADEVKASIAYLKREKAKRITMAERDKSRPKGFSV